MLNTFTRMNLNCGAKRGGHVSCTYCKIVFLYIEQCVKCGIFIYGSTQKTSKAKRHEREGSHNCRRIQFIALTDGICLLGLLYHTFSLVWYMDQIYIKTPNPKCWFFLKIYQHRFLAAGVYLSEAPPLLWPHTPPPPLLHTVYVCTVYLFTQGRGE